MDSDDDRQSGKTLGAGQTDIYSPIAQSVERRTVNSDAVGSSPTGGASKGGSK